MRLKELLSDSQGQWCKSEVAFYLLPLHSPVSNICPAASPSRDWAYFCWTWLKVTLVPLNYGWLPFSSLGVPKVPLVAKWQINQTILPQQCGR